MILEHGRVHTLDPALPTARAVAITRDGRIARGVEAWEGDVSQVSNERIDLEGRTVVPGLVDAHVHFLGWALAREQVDLGGAMTLAGCVATVGARRSADRLAGRDSGWLLGAGWQEGAIGETPTAVALDAVTGDRPCALWAHDHHSLWLNTAALAALDLTAATSAPPGGVIERDAAGRPAGVVREHAAWRLALPREPAGRHLEMVAEAQRLAHARGVTAVHDFQADGGLAVWQELHAARRLTLRVLASVPADHADGLIATGLRSGFGDERLQLGHVKAFLDGTLGSRTATMLAPYDDAAPNGRGTGVQLMAGDAFEDLVRRAAAGGLAVAVHAIGDRANRDALDAFERTADAWRGLPLPPRIEHAQLLHPDDLARPGALGVVVSMQPTHATSDRDEADRAWGERTVGAYAWRSVHASGATLAFGSDAPIEELDPLAALCAAVTRTSGSRPPWRPEEAIGPLEALSALVTGPARAAGWQRRLGSLAPGRHADLVVLDGDPVTCPPDRLDRIGVVATMVGGRWVHGRPPW